MAALAYLLLPISGLFAYFGSASPRVRFHGLQAVLVGFLWPAAIYAGSALSQTAALMAWVGGAAVWLGLMLTTAAGLDLRIPVVGRYLRRAATQGPR
jgi:uncharacterized membrane protein